VIVLDASALMDWLLQTPGRGAAVADQMLRSPVHHTVDFALLEVVAGLRRKVRRGVQTHDHAEMTIRLLQEVPLRLHSPAPLIPRVWALRHNHGAYDAAYVALAEALRVPLITTDRRLARSRGHRATIVEASA
jgi:predicted nucleic acid-binding protein